MKPYQLKRIENTALAVILLLALALRLDGLGWGMPNARHLFSYHPDEAPLLGAVWYILTTGDWDPHFYHYGTFYIYLVAVCAKAGALMGLVAVPQGGWVELHWIARALTALMGTATVYFAYLIAKRLGGLPVGLGAAALLAVLPAHVVNAHYATVDIPATFLVTLLLFILLHLFGRAEISWYVLAGVVLGLAAATKYTVVLAAVPFLAAHIFGRDEHGYSPSILYLIVGIAVAAVAFYAVTPYMLLLTKEGFRLNPDMVRDVRFEMEHMRAGGTFAFVNTGPGWVYHLLRSLPAAMGYAALALALVGAVLMMQRGGAVGLVLFAFALPYFGVVGAGKERFLRYMIPLLPVLAISAVYALWRLRQASLAGLGPWGSLAAPALLAAGVFAVTLWYASQMVQIMAAPDVRTAAADWLRPRLERTTKVGLADAPWYYTPAITPYNAGALSLAEFQRWQQDNPPYRIIIIGWDAAKLRRERPHYFIVSDAEYADLLRLKRPDAVALMNALPQSYAKLRAFEPPPPLPWLRPPKLACPPDWLYTWPRVEVFY